MTGYATSQGNRPTGATLDKPRRQQVQRPRRPDLQFRLNGLAPYVAYATSYNPIIGLNASNQLFLPETGAADRDRLEIPADGFNGHFGIAVI